MRFETMNELDFIRQLQFFPVMFNFIILIRALIIDDFTYLNYVTILCIIGGIYIWKFGFNSPKNYISKGVDFL